MDRTAPKPAQPRQASCHGPAYASIRHAMNGKPFETFLRVKAKPLPFPAFVSPQDIIRNICVPTLHRDVFPCRALEASWFFRLWTPLTGKVRSGTPVPGRGGKTLALMELGLPILAASDTYRPRLRGLRDDAKRLMLGIPSLICASAAAPAIRGIPRTILLDVPCSGLGTLARHPDLRRLRTPGQIRELVQLQQAILDAAWEVLPSGGRIAYVTCTVNPEENETQIARFLQRHPGTRLDCQWESSPDRFGSDLMYGALVRKL